MITVSLCILSFAVLVLSLKIDKVNKHLDQVAQANLEHKRDDVKKALQLLLRNTSALEQVGFCVPLVYNYCH